RDREIKKIKRHCCCCHFLLFVINLICRWGVTRLGWGRNLLALVDVGSLSIASDLGFTVPPPPMQEDLQNLVTTTGDKSDDLIRVLRELPTAQQKIADLQVELQGRKDRIIASVATTIFIRLHSGGSMNISKQTHPYTLRGLRLCTPPQRKGSNFDDLVMRNWKNQEMESQDENSEVSELQSESMSQRWLSWPPLVKKNGL
ncbi:hypothetical protein IFM89_007332, partial [Coptis chinensis]